MSKVTTRCPHCGKLLSSPDKLGWHLSRECPEAVAIMTASAGSKPGEQPAKAEGKH